jgi:imidazolonepropionase-like amidohydrolase
MLLGLLGCAPPGEGTTAYVGMELWDGTGAPIIHDAVILVAAGRIQAAGPPDLVRVPRGAVEVRLDGRWVIPGMVDAHAHVSRDAAGQWVAGGVTSVRDMGGPQSEVVALREAIDVGEVDGPRLFISGAPGDGPSPTWPYATVIRGSGEARRLVGDRVLIDVTQISIGPRVDRRTLEVLLDEARSLETPVAVELGNVDLATAVRLGVRSIELLTGLPNWQVPDSADAERVVRLLMDARVTLVPALARRGGTGTRRAASELFIRRFRTAGGIVGAGSDAGRGSGTPGTGMHEELAALVAAGFTPAQALLTATRDGARLLGIDSIGAIAAGQPADFVVLTADPLADIRNVARIERVVIAGQGYDPAGSQP